MNHKDDFEDERYKEDSESLYADVISLATQTKDMLSRNLPVLLSREKFFQRAFKI